MTAKGAAPVARRLLIFTGGMSGSLLAITDASGVSNFADLMNNESVCPELYILTPNVRRMIWLDSWLVRVIQIDVYQVSICDTASLLDNIPLAK